MDNYEKFLIFCLIPLALIIFSFNGIRIGYARFFGFRNVIIENGSKEELPKEEKREVEFAILFLREECYLRSHGKKTFDSNDDTSYSLFWILFRSAIMIVVPVLFILFSHAAGLFRMTTCPFLVEFCLVLLWLMYILVEWLKLFLATLDIYLKMIKRINIFHYFKIQKNEYTTFCPLTIWSELLHFIDEQRLW
jgi:hypothetical protein